MNVPAWVKVWVALASFASVPEFHEPPSAVQVWDAESRLVAVTVVPTPTSSTAGLNVKFWMVMVDGCGAAVVGGEVVAVVGGGGGAVVGDAVGGGGGWVVAGAEVVCGRGGGGAADLGAVVGGAVISVSEGSP